MDTTTDNDLNDTSYSISNVPSYIRTKITPCPTCIHYKNLKCTLALFNQIYCKFNSYCYKINNPDVALYVQTTMSKKFIEDDEFEV